MKPLRLAGAGIFGVGFESQPPAPTPTLGEPAEGEPEGGEDRLATWTLSSATKAWSSGTALSNRSTSGIGAPSRWRARLPADRNAYHPGAVIQGTCG